MARIGDIVTVTELGNDLHVIIGQAPKGYWLQNLRTGALPTKQHRVKDMEHSWRNEFITIEGGYLPKDMTLTGTRHLDYAQASCQSTGTNHSADLVEHHSGSTTPELVCGYHLFANTEWRN